MQITVHLHTVLQMPTPEGLRSRLDMDVPVNSTVRALLARLEISLPLEALLLVVNGRLAPPDYILHENDTVHLMPAISGGSEFTGEVSS